MAAINSVTLQTVRASDGLYVEFEADALDTSADSLDTSSFFVDTWRFVDDSIAVNTGADEVTLTADVRPDNFSGSGQYPEVPTTVGETWSGTLATSTDVSLEQYDTVTLTLNIEHGGTVSDSQPTTAVSSLTEDDLVSTIDTTDELARQGGDVRLDTISDQQARDELEIVPKLQQLGGENNDTVIREFTPNVVTALGGTLPWNTDSKQLQCQQTITEADGDMNIRLRYECVATKSEFIKLQRMRETPQDIYLVSAVYTNPVTFDQLKFERVTDSNGHITTNQGVREEPKYEIQLQSKEGTESGGGN
jgi:hypothetical protein